MDFSALSVNQNADEDDLSALIAQAHNRIRQNPDVPVTHFPQKRGSSDDEEGGRKRARVEERAGGIHVIRPQEESNERAEAMRKLARLAEEFDGPPLEGMPLEGSTDDDGDDPATAETQPPSRDPVWDAIVGRSSEASDEEQDEFSEWFDNIGTAAEKRRRGRDGAAPRPPKQAPPPPREPTPEPEMVPYGVLRSNCFLCEFTHRRHDRIMSHEAEAFNRFIDEHVLSVPIPMLAIILHEYYEELRDHYRLPAWSTDGIEAHLRNHQTESRVLMHELAYEIYRPLIRGLAAKVLTKEGGEVKLNVTAEKALARHMGIFLRILSSDPTKMIGFNQGMKPNTSQTSSVMRHQEYKTVDEKTERLSAPLFAGGRR